MIKWLYSGSVGTAVRIELLKSGVVNRTISTSTSIGSGGSGQFNWTIPSSQTLGSDFKVRVTSATVTGTTDSSDSNFTLTNPAITLTAPNGGELWRPGETHNITWTYSGSPGNDVRLELLKAGSVVQTITAAAPIGSSGSGSSQWVVPEITPGADYTIKITSNQNAAYTDASNAAFLLGDYFTVTVNKIATSGGTGTVTSTPAGVSC